MATEPLADDASVADRADAAMALLGDDEDELQDQGQSDGQSAGDDLAGDDAPGDGSASEDDQAGGDESGESSTIEAPETFSDELKVRFKALPADLQSTLAQWEGERNRGVNQKLEEAAALRKTYDTEIAATKTHRQQLVAQLEQAIQLQAQFNPVIAEGLKMTQDDWMKLMREDKAGYIEKLALFNAEVGKVQAAQQQLNELRQQEHLERGKQHNESVAQQAELLAKAMPDLIDPATKKLDPKKAQAFAGEVSQALVSHGFTAEEINGVTDHRMLTVVRDAIKWRKSEAARKAAASKQRIEVPRVLRPGSGDAGRGGTRDKALATRVRGMTSTADQADAIASMLD